MVCVVTDLEKKRSFGCTTLLLLSGWFIFDHWKLLPLLLWPHLPLSRFKMRHENWNYDGNSLPFIFNCSHIRWIWLGIIMWYQSDLYFSPGHFCMMPMWYFNSGVRKLFRLPIFTGDYYRYPIGITIYFYQFILHQTLQTVFDDHFIFIGLW